MSSPPDAVSPLRLIPSAPSFHVAVVLPLYLIVLLLWAASASAAQADWEPVRKVHGIQVEGLMMPSGFRSHRAQVAVCTDLADLRAFISDTSRFHEWIPDLAEVRLLEQSDDGVVYYMRSKAPWPVKDRDMVYRLFGVPESGDAASVALAIEGLPGRLPEVDGAYRMHDVSGQWRIWERGDRLDVQQQIYLNPGDVPRMFANRSMSASLARTLGNLASRYPCPKS